VRTAGAGADGGATPRFAAYGSTKRGLAQFQKSLSAELKLQNLSNVHIHNLSPGMVTTGTTSLLWVLDLFQLLHPELGFAGEGG
jgi:NAD(P)-dependent dehydrogenase (short-subunit alcohol dehydrogenase family)